MAKERVQKFAQKSSTQKKRSKIAPPPIDEQLQADSVSSPKVNTYGIPSKEQRDAIKRKLFNVGAKEGWVDTAIPQPLANPIQTKLTIGEPGDKYEQEADRVAALVVKQINTPTQKPSTQRSAGGSSGSCVEQAQSQPVQRQELSEENEELQRKPAVQLQASAGGMTASADLESAIQQARSGGQPLADNIREPMEQAFGADFSGVKIHTDSQADQLNRATQARAFATGQDVFFRSGEYNPGSREGQELLAHELTHVVQQNSGVVQRSSKGMKIAENEATKTHGEAKEHRANIQFNKSQDVIQRNPMRINNNRGITLVMTDEIRNHIWERHAPDVRFGNHQEEYQGLFAPNLVPNKQSLDAVAAKVFSNGEWSGKEVYLNFGQHTGYGSNAQGTEGSYKGVRLFIEKSETEPETFLVKTMYPTGGFRTFDQENYTGGKH